MLRFSRGLAISVKKSVLYRLSSGLFFGFLGFLKISRISWIMLGFIYRQLSQAHGHFLLPVISKIRLPWNINEALVDSQRFITAK